MLSKIVSLFKKIAQKLGVNLTIVYTIMERSIQVGGGLITLIFVSKYLSPTEQGYYYTFGSILAIQVFFELGLSSIITQYVAHEKAHLTWIDDFSFSGSEQAASRLSSLLRFSIKWFLVIGLGLFIALIITGHIFFLKFGKGNESVQWQIPWIIFSTFTSLNLMSSPVLGFIEGLGKIKEVAKVRLIQQTSQLLLSFTFFSLGFKLYSTPMATLSAFLIIPIWIFITKKHKLFQFIWNKIGEWRVNYRLEIFPFQWKIALSWISSYFIFQFFNPVIFATEGAVLAGQMGMTIGVLNVILMFPLSWILTKVPIFSEYISRKEYFSLDKLFNKTLLQSTFINLFFLVSFFIFVMGLKYFDIEFNGKKLGYRFLPTIPLVLMMIPVFFNHITMSLASYLRCHKEEPMFIQSLTMAFLCPLSTLFFGKRYGIIGVTLGYAILTSFSLIWAIYTFLKKKKQWHE